MVAIVRALKPGETIFGGGAGVVTWNSYDNLRKQTTKDSGISIASDKESQPQDIAVEISKEWLIENPVQTPGEPLQPGEELERHLIEMALRSNMDEPQTAQAPESEASSTSIKETSSSKNDRT